MLNGSRPAAEAEELRAGLAAETGAEIGYTQANLGQAASARELVGTPSPPSAAWTSWSITPASSTWRRWTPSPTTPGTQLIAINLSSVFHTTKAALPGMKARGWGRIVNIASAHGVVASRSRRPTRPASMRWWV
jgi:3-hydroxybutyrate dehydrogenase